MPATGQEVILKAHKRREDEDVPFDTTLCLRHVQNANAQSFKQGLVCRREVGILCK